MDTKEYQALIENIAKLADELRKLGERQDKWTDEETAAWNQLDEQYQAAVTRKKEEDDRRTAEAVQVRMASLENPLTSRKVPMPASIMRKRIGTPKYSGTLKAFRGEDREKCLNDAYDCGLWLKATLLRDRDSIEKLEHRQPEWRAQTEGAASAGGYTVPDPLSNAIIEVLNETSVALRVADVIPMTADTLKVPKITAGQTVYYPGEATAITASDVTFAQVALTAVKRATLTKVSNELIADSVIAMADRVARRAAYQLAYQLDNEFINGDGTGTYGGETGLIVGLTGTGTAGIASTTSTNLWSEIALTDFNKTMGTLPDRYWNGSLYWIMRRDFYAAVVTKLMYAAGGNTVTDIMGGSGPSLMGYPIAFTNLLPAQADNTIPVLFGNFMEAAIIGMRNNISVASSDQFAFNEDVTTIRTLMRYDIAVHDTGDASNAGAYVGFKLLT